MNFRKLSKISFSILHVVSEKLRLLNAEKIVAFAVIGRYAVRLDSRAMLLSGVALVLVPAVERIFLMELVHVVITKRLG